MRVVIINKSDSTGGAAVVSRRLGEALRAEGAQVDMIVCEKLTGLDWIHLAASKRRMMIPFLAERVRIWIAEGLRRKNLFKVDAATDGLPLWRHPLVKRADVVCLGWINQGMLSLRGIKEIRDLGKPLFWTLHDMWAATGICHHAGRCGRFKHGCGSCPFLSPCSGSADLSHTIWKRKRALYAGGGITLIPVSSWLAGKCAESGLTRGVPTTTIGNPFLLPERIERRPHGLRRQLLFGAARLDDPIKGLSLLHRSLRIFAKEYPELAAGCELTTFGSVRDAGKLADFPISHRHLGVVKGEEAVKNLYLQSDIVLSTSLFETLPGTLVEGQAYGAVPVSFDRGGQCDIIEDGVTGFLVRLTDDEPASCREFAHRLSEAIKAVDIEGDEIRRRMQESVRQRFASKAVAQKYLRLFDKELRRKNEDQ